MRSRPDGVVVPLRDGHTLDGRVGRYDGAVISKAAYLSLAAAAAGSALLVALSIPGRDGEAPGSTAFTAPGLEAMSPDTAIRESYRLAPALLLVVYDAFGRAGETEIYDTLSAVAHGDALEELYLERVGAMARGGLEQIDQTIHEIRLEDFTARRSGDALVIGAVWQVIGTVGHAEHLHVRGNTYSADLTVAPVGDAWKITAFELLDVNRDAAGEMFLAPQTN